KAVGYGGERPQQYDNFIELKQAAEKEELLQLTDHSNPTVRCYAFWALTFDPTVELYPIVLDHLSDEQSVTTQLGCIRGGKPVGDFFLDKATPFIDEIAPNKLDTFQLAAIDSILIHRPSKLFARAEAIERAKTTESMYTVIRMLVLEEKNEEALVKLASYKRDQDVKVILSFRDASNSGDGDVFFTYKAINQFPHPDFFPFLEANLRNTFDKTHYNHHWQELYRAIAKYKNNKSVALLYLPLSKVQDKYIREYHMDYLSQALSEVRAPIYNDLLWKLWEEEYRITLDGFECLSNIDSTRAFELTRESLMNLYQLSMQRDSHDSLVHRMLEWIVSKEYEMGLEIIGTNIRNANITYFSIFTDKAAALKEPSLVEPLFDRFSRESNGHIYLPIAEALLAYGDAGITKLMHKTRTNNKELNVGWGGKSLDRLLEENNK
ncbi:MAG: hypothetical protein AAGI38_15175, partial [Bacteroidota bacterium]